ncbi:hypothetical protein [Marinomonas sp. PE14-40]|uniref:hypothetical protein n=1 Tax=Marinomonas sp. PE14-40 TaxID=3060621 RepID=UPI003F6793CF
MTGKINVNVGGKQFIGWLEEDLNKTGINNNALLIGFNEKQKAFRFAAYKSESDLLYMEWQFDHTPEAEQTWRNKVAEIKARYPLTDNEL